MFARRYSLSTVRAAILMAIALQSLACGNTEEEFEPVRFIQVTDDVDEDLMSSISPDGAYVAISRFGGSSFDIWVKSIDGTVSRQLTSNPLDELYPAWSPDGAWIAYSREIHQGCDEIYRISASGGPEEFLAYGNDPSWDRTSMKLVHMACPDTSIGSEWGIAYYSLADSMTTPFRGVGLTSVEPVYANLSDRVAFGAGEFLPPQRLDVRWDIWIVSSEEAVKVTHTRAAGSAAWSPDDKYLAYIFDASLYIVRLADSAVREVDTSSIPGTHYIERPTWSRNGDSISMSIGRNSIYDIFVMQNVSTFLRDF